MNPHQVYVSIGSNIQPSHNIHSGVRALREIYGELQVSPVYESAAVGFTGDNFYNLVVGFQTQEEALAVNQCLAEIETAHHRQRGHEKFSSRTLDLDLLLYDQQIIEQDKLRLPRDEILKYAFVLRPLADIFPQGKHPITQHTYADLWQAFNASHQALWVVDVTFS